MYYCAQLALLGINIILVEIFFRFHFFPHLSEAAGKGRKGMAKLLLIFLYFPAVDAHLKTMTHFVNALISCDSFKMLLPSRHKVVLLSFETLLPKVSSPTLERK